jgi:hypothetical protein
MKNLSEINKAMNFVNRLTLRQPVAAIVERPD